MWEPWPWELHAPDRPSGGSVCSCRPRLNEGVSLERAGERSTHAFSMVGEASTYEEFTRASGLRIGTVGLLLQRFWATPEASSRVVPDGAEPSDGRRSLHDGPAGYGDPLAAVNRAGAAEAAIEPWVPRRLVVVVDGHYLTEGPHMVVSRAKRALRFAVVRGDSAERVARRESITAGNSRSAAAHTGPAFVASAGQTPRPCDWLRREIAANGALRVAHLNMPADGTCRLVLRRA